VSYSRPDAAALEELERMCRTVTDQAAQWRRRSLKAESELQEVKAKGGVLAGPELVEARRRAVALEVENEDLRSRISRAEEKLTQLLEQLSFLEREALSR